MRHLCLGHIHLNRIQSFVKKGPLSDLKVEPLPTCESCLERKIIKRPFLSKENRAMYYFINFTDDFSRYGYIYLKRRKSKSFKISKNLKLKLKDILILNRMLIFKQFLNSQHPYTPQQNIVEKRNKTLLDMVHSMQISYSSLSTSFWGLQYKKLFIF